MSLNQNQKKISDITLALAQHFKEEASTLFVRNYIIGLQEFEDVNWGLVHKHCLQKFDRMPSVKQICEMIRPPQKRLAERQTGISIIMEIESAVRKFGYNNSFKAKESLSDHAWFLVQKIGGWECACRYRFKDSAYHAQLRDMAEVIVMQINNAELDISILPAYEARNERLNQSGHTNIQNKKESQKDALKSLLSGSEKLDQTKNFKKQNQKKEMEMFSAKEILEEIPF